MVKPQWVMDIPTGPLPIVRLGVRPPGFVSMGKKQKLSRYGPSCPDAKTWLLGSFEFALSSDFLDKGSSFENNTASKQTGFWIMKWYI